MYEKCKLCPNYCQVDRRVKVGLCGQSDKVRIAWSGLHRGEEPPLTGEKGSGMIFFTGCPLHCKYCQNHQISGALGSNMGFNITNEELSELMLSLQEQGATTLNLVTGTHFIPSIIEALIIAKDKGFNLPVVYNSSGYESIEGLTLIDPYIDLYLIHAPWPWNQIGKDCTEGNIEVWKAIVDDNHLLKEETVILS